MFFVSPLADDEMRENGEGILMQNDKPINIPFSTIADMARNILYASCNRKKEDPGGYVNGGQADVRDKLAVIVAYSKCRERPHKGTSILASCT